MTELTFLNDSNLFISDAKILEIGENEFGTFIILDKTIFYPQGGGQPSDTGDISIGDNSYYVKKAVLNEDGNVYHYGDFSEGSVLNMGDEVKLEINTDQRVFNTKNHSAGHLIDVVISNMGLNIIPGKGFHFPQGSYVEYKGSLGEIDKQEFIDKLNKEIKELIEKDILMKISYEEKISAPTAKVPRYVQFEGYDGCGCGGTHVSSSSEIGGINIKKVKEKKGMTKISYEIV